MFHGQSWHSSVVSSSLDSDHRPLRSFIDERMIWGLYAICSLPGWLIYLDSLEDKDQCLPLMVQRLHRCNRDTTHFNFSPDLEMMWINISFMYKSEWQQGKALKWMDLRLTVFCPGNDDVVMAHELVKRQSSFCCFKGTNFYSSTKKVWLEFNLELMEANAHYFSLSQ